MSDIPTPGYLRVKWYPTASFRMYQGRFIGQRDGRAIERLSNSDFMRLLSDDMERERTQQSDDTTSEEEDDDSDIAENDPLPEHSDFLRLIHLCYQNAGAAGDYILRDDISPIQKAIIEGLIVDYSERRIEQGDVPLGFSGRARWHDRYPTDLMVEDDLVPVTNAWIDVFRKDVQAGHVFLWCEYYADEYGMVQSVPVRNLSDSREPVGGSVEHIAIPMHQELFVSVSTIKPTARRLEAMRRHIERDPNFAGVHRIPEQKTGRLPTDPNTNFRTTLEEIRDIRNAEEAIPSTLYANRRDLENVLVNDAGELVVAMHDYFGFADALRDEFDTLYDAYLRATGMHPDDEPDDEPDADTSGDYTPVITPSPRNAERLNERLKYLIVSACMENGSRWVKVAGGDTYRELSQLSEDYQNNTAQLLWVARYLAEWIAQPAFSEWMITELYSGLEGEETILERPVRLLRNLADVPGTADALTRLVDGARQNHEAALVWRNGPRTPEQLAATYWEPTGPSLNDNFDVLETYENAEKPPSAFWAYLYPSALNKNNNVALLMIDQLAKPIVHAGSITFAERVPRYLAAWLNRVKRGRVSLTVTDIADGSGAIWAPVDLRVTVVTPAANTDTVQRLSAKMKTHADILKRTLTLLDAALVVHKITKEGLTVETAVYATKMTVALLSTFTDIDQRISAPTAANATGMGVGPRVWANAANIFDFVLGAIDFFNLARRGDWDTAVVRGGGSMVLAAISIRHVILLKMGVAVAPWVPAVMALARIGIAVVSHAAENDEIDDWIRFSEYGRADRRTALGNRNRLREDFFEMYDTLIGADRYANLVDNEADLDKRPNEITQPVLNHWNNPATQIEAYQSLVYSFTIDDAWARYTFTGYDAVAVARYVRLEISTRVLSPYAHFTFEILDDTEQNLVHSVELNAQNSAEHVDGRTGRTKIVTYLYEDRDYLEWYALRAPGEIDLPYIQAPSTIHALSGEESRWRKFRARVSLRMKNVTDEDLSRAGIGRRTLAEDSSSWPLLLTRSRWLGDFGVNDFEEDIYERQTQQEIR